MSAAQTPHPSRSAQSPAAGSGGPWSPRRSPGGLLWELKRLHTIAVRLEERIGDLYWELQRHDPQARAASSDSSRVDTVGQLPPARLPVAWVTRVTTTLKPDGSLLVSLNGKAPFLLQPHLGTLLLALAEDTGMSRDEGVGFKTLRDLSMRIGKQTGSRGPSPDTINKYICRLRQRLCRAGMSSDVIQTNRRLGRRLALRRSGRAAP